MIENKGGRKAKINVNGKERKNLADENESLKIATQRTA